MFKRIILALVCLSFTLSGFAAKLTATLQSGDKVTPFYGDNAFVEAYNAAVNGDIITLSPGSFKATDIEKSITVIGTYAFSTDLSEATQFSSSVTISGDNVTLEGIRFTNTTNEKGLMIQGADNLTINRCYIALLNDVIKTTGHMYHNNTILTDCWIEKFNAMSLSQNAVLRNCSVNRFVDKNRIEYPALIEKCNVSLFAYYSYGLTVEYEQPYAIYRNCWLGLYKTADSTSAPFLSFSAPSEFMNNWFEPTYLSAASSTNYVRSWTIQYGSATYSGNMLDSAPNYGRVDTNVRPSFGNFDTYKSCGPADHKAYPAIPSITSSEIDTKTDAEGNLHVKITATAHD